MVAQPLGMKELVVSYQRLLVFIIPEDRLRNATDVVVSIRPEPMNCVKGVDERFHL